MRHLGLACAVAALWTTSLVGCAADAPDERATSIGQAALAPIDRAADVDEARAAPPKARLIAPLSTASVTTATPTLRWTEAAGRGRGAAFVELCRDRACASPLAVYFAFGDRLTVPSALPAGVVYWRVYALRGFRIAPPSKTWQLHVGVRSAPVDTSWGSSFDANGDGFADAAAGATGANRAYVMSASGGVLTPTTTLDGPDPGRFGAAVASAGDVNGDGFADLIVGNPDANRAYVYLGGTSGLASAPAVTLVGASGDVLGESVSSAGDVNGDGYADVIVSARGNARAYVFYGGAAATAATPSLTLPAPFDATTSITGFATEVSSAGDIDGDGLGDVMVGAPHGASGAGRAYVYVGGASGFATPIAIDAPDALDDGDSGQFGSALACAGDVDGDGYADLVIGAPQVRVPPGPSDEKAGSGRAYVIRSSGGAVGGGGSIRVGARAQLSVRFGAAVASAGDYDGDGFADVVVGSPNGPIGAEVNGAGLAFVFLGSATGTSPSAIGYLTDDGNALGRFGAAVASPGDVDGDGLSDIMVGAYRAITMIEGLHPGPGQAYLFRGIASPPAFATPTQTIAGSDGNGKNFGFSVE